jgi:apolipoprotein N-acyltransferase
MIKQYATLNSFSKNRKIRMTFQKYFASGWRGDALAILSGALLTLAFAPFNLSPLALFSPAILLGLWLPVGAGRAFYRGWLFGLGLFSTGVYWVYISIHTFGDAPIWLSLVITLGFINILALFPAGMGYVLNRYFPKLNDTKILCAFPAIWVFLEWIRGFIFTGFPWLTLGYSQIHTPLKGYAPIFSVHGVSLVTLISAALIFNALRYLKPKKNIEIINQHIFTLAVIWIVGGGLSFIHWTHPIGAPIQVSLVQGNIPQEIKWSPEALMPTLKQYQQLTAKHWDSKIIIWPEGAIPVPLQSAQEFIEDTTTTARKYNTTIVSGIPIKANDREGYYNAVIATGTGHGVYLKRRLVPFGEYIPFENHLHNLLAILNIPMSDFIVNRKYFPPLEIDGIKISVFICYEIAFPEQVRDGNADVGLTLTVSNDAWFGHSIAQDQHLQIAEMRAVELGRPILFVSNNGITAIINPKGRVQASIPPFETGVLTDKVQPYHGLTPWQHAGLDPCFIIIIFLLFVGIRNRKS